MDLLVHQVHNGAFNHWVLINTVPLHVLHCMVLLPMLLFHRGMETLTVDLALMNYIPNVLTWVLNVLVLFVKLHRLSKEVLLSHVGQVLQKEHSIPKLLLIECTLLERKTMKVTCSIRMNLTLNSVGWVFVWVIVRKDFTNQMWNCPT